MNKYNKDIPFFGPDPPLFGGLDTHKVTEKKSAKYRDINKLGNSTKNQASPCPKKLSQKLHRKKKHVNYQKGKKFLSG